MVYRNGWKEFFITAISFGIPMSLFFIIQYGITLAWQEGFWPVFSSAGL